MWHSTVVYHHQTASIRVVVHIIILIVVVVVVVSIWSTIAVFNSVLLRVKMLDSHRKRLRLYFRAIKTVLNCLSHLLHMLHQWANKIMQIHSPFSMCHEWIDQHITAATKWRWTRRYNIKRKRNRDRNAHTHTISTNTVCLCVLHE